MRISKLGWIGAAVVLGSCAAVVATAQTDPAQPPAGGRRGGQGRGGFGQFGGRGGALTLLSPQLSVDLLAKELKLTDDQKATITKVRAKAQEDMQALMAPPADGSQPNFAELRPKMTEINQKATKDIEAALKDDQKTDATALLKNLTAVNALGIPVGTYSDLKLTDDQKKKLGELAADVAKDRAAKQAEITAAQQAGDQQKAQELRQAMFASLGNGQPNEKGLAVLTADQKDLVTKYIKDHPRRPGGFGPGANRAPHP